MLKYSNEIIENHDDLKKLLIRDRVPNIVFYEVYRGTPSIELENAFGGLEEDEVFYRIDLDSISERGFMYLCRLPDWFCEGMNLPIGSLETIPYIRSFIVCTGYLGKVSSPQEIPTFLENARKEKNDIRDLCDKYRVKMASTGID